MDATNASREETIVASEDVTLVPVGSRWIGLSAVLAMLVFGLPTVAWSGTTAVAFGEDGYPGLRLQGTAERLVFGVDGQPMFTVRYNFSLASLGRSWQLSRTSGRAIDGSGSQPVPDQFYFGDESGFYSGHTSASGPGGILQRRASIAPAPRRDTSIGDPVWMTILSGSLAGETSDASLPPPWHRMAHLDREGFFRVEVERSPAAPHCLTLVRWHHPGYTFNTRGDERPLAPPFDEGYLAGELRARGSVSIDNYEVPAEILLEHYGLKSVVYGRVERFLEGSFHAVITEVTRMEEPLSRPPMIPGTVVMDQRVQDPDRRLRYLTYTQDAAVWPDTNDPTVVAALEQFNLRHPLAATDVHRLNRWVALGLVVVVVLAPVLPVVLRRLKKGKGKGSDQLKQTQKGKCRNANQFSTHTWTGVLGGRMRPPHPSSYRCNPILAVHSGGVHGHLSPERLSVGAHA
jgi:hypothetical protein